MLKVALSQAFSVCAELCWGIVLHPPTHWYVGGAAESAGVCVGDVVLEVNGEKCEDCDVAKIVTLKTIIQQTNVGSS